MIIFIILSQLRFFYIKNLDIFKLLFYLFKKNLKIFLILIEKCFKLSNLVQIFLNYINIVLNLKKPIFNLNLLFLKKV